MHSKSQHKPLQSNDILPKVSLITNSSIISAEITLWFSFLYCYKYQTTSVLNRFIHAQQWFQNHLRDSENGDE